MPAELVVVKGKDRGVSLALKADCAHTIGRADECDLRLKGDKKAFDLEVRPGLMVQAIHQLQDAGIEADVWKIEGLDRREDCVQRRL